MRQPRSINLLGAAFLLIALGAARPDGNSDMNMNLDMETEDNPQSYFALSEHSSSFWHTLSSRSSPGASFFLLVSFLFHGYVISKLTGQPSC